MIRFSLVAFIVAILSAVLGFWSTIYSNIDIGKMLILTSIASFSLSLVFGILANQYRYQLTLHTHKKYMKNKI